MALGLMETEDIVKSGAQGVGNPVVYVGSTTGRDGMGGASFASAALSADSWMIVRLFRWVILPEQD